MPIRVTCPTCGGVLTAPDAAAGKRGKCPKCKSAIAIPAAASEPAAPKRSGPLPVATVLREPAAAVVEQFDVEILPDAPPPARPAPVARTIAPPSPPLSGPPSPVPAGNPFAVFGPPPDSAAAKLRIEGPDSDGPTRPPMHPGWQTVETGIGSLKVSAWIGFAVAICSAFGSLFSTLGAPLVFYVAGGLSLVAILVALIFHFIGLVRCLKMPQPEEGGAGRGLALTALILTAAGVVLSPCFGIGALALFAVPFVLGTFLRGIGRILPDRLTTAESLRFMIASAVSIVASILAPLMMFFAMSRLTGSSESLRTLQILAILLSLGTAVINCVPVYYYLAALGHAERAVRSAIRTRGVGTAQPEPRSRPVDDDESPTPLAIRRPASPTRKSRDESNPFA